MVINAIRDDFCSLAAKRLESSLTLPTVGASHSQASNESVEQALSTIRSMLSDAGQKPRIAISGTCVDVQTARAAVGLAANFDAMLDVEVSHSEACFAEVGEREGWVGATLGEVAERADSILLIGPVEANLPRLWNLLGDDNPSRRVKHLEKVETLTEVVDLVKDPSIREKLREGSLTRSTTDGEQLAAWLCESKYLAILWAGNVLDLLSAGALVRLVDLLNQKGRRAVLVPISEAITFRTTAAWLTSFGGPLRFQDGLPVLLERSTLTDDHLLSPDVRIWLHPFPDSPAPPMDDAKLIVIGAADNNLASRSACYVRTAMPGVEYSGTSFRGDGTIALPLTGWLKSAYPSAAEILRELASKW